MIWLFGNFLKCKIKKIPAKSRLFRGILEVHVGKKARQKSEFLMLVIDSILWAKRNNVSRALLFTWYGNEKLFKSYFNGFVTISEPSRFERLCNFTLNLAYNKKNKIGDKRFKVTIDVGELSTDIINSLEKKRERLHKRINR